ncbi:MAG TPA: group II truncated hemoglobin [Polyangiaceae bacterium]|nr:group II truncated hemoglobin [Polyangiaceae bacterium]
MDSPFASLGGEATIRDVVARFYDAMSEHEPELAKLHPCDADGKVSRGPRDKFALFFIGWLGGPQDYVERYGHPRLRMRHAHVPIDTKMADAWMRCMRMALDQAGLAGDARAFVEARLAEVAAFLRNQAG